MNLPEIVAALIDAQNSYDSMAYANCFSEAAIVFDEGNDHEGKDEIRQWIEEANEKYRTVLQPTGYKETETGGVLTVGVSGTFDGSPTTMQYHIELRNDKIQSLKIT